MQIQHLYSTYDLAIKTKKQIKIMKSIFISILLFSNFAVAQHPDYATSEVKTVTSLITQAPEGARVFITEPTNGIITGSPITIKFSMKNMELATAGRKHENSGHHHILVDLEEQPNMTRPLPTTNQIIHFGKAQTKTTLELTPGEHSFQLLLDNFAHIPHNPPARSDKTTSIAKTGQLL